MKGRLVTGTHKGLWWASGYFNGMHPAVEWDATLNVELAYTFARCEFCDRTAKYRVRDTSMKTYGLACAWHAPHLVEEKK